MQSLQGWHVVSEHCDPAKHEAMWLRAGRAGDTAALEQLLAQHERGLLRLCRGMLGQPEDAEDAVQETFLRALRSIGRFRGEAGFNTWLYRIAVNICLDWKTSRRPVESLHENRSAMAAADSPETSVLHRMQAQEALRTLGARHRAVLLLKEVEGWNVSEIAAALKCNEKKVHNDLYQARCALADWRRNALEENER